MTYPGTKDINLLELLLTSMKGGSKYPFELNYLAGTLAGFINPSDKRVVSYSEEQLSPAVTADLKELYNTINAGRSWRGIPVVIAISNAKGEPISELVMPAARERLLQNYPLVGTTLGSVNKPFGTKDECIVIGNYDHEALMKELRSGLNPALRLNYDIPNGFITRALYDISEAAVRDIGQKYELYGKNFYVARSSSDGFKVQTNFYFSETAKPNEVVKREFTFKCASTDPSLGTAPYEVRAQVIQGENQPKLINNITNKVVGFSTKLMDELQAAGGESEMMKNFSAAIDDTLAHGVTSMYSEGRQLQFSEMDGSVMVQDPMNNEATMVTPNPMDPNNMQLQPAPMPGAAGAPMPGAMPGAVPMGQPMMQPVIDPNTGQPMIDPNTGQPVMQPVIDPNSGQPVMQPMIDPTTGMPMGAGTPMDPAMMAQGGMAPQQGAMPMASPQTGAYNFAPGANSLQAVDQGAVTGTFSDTTNVMNKLFSSGEEGNAYRKKFSEAIDRAFSDGGTVMYDEGKQINFAEVNGEVFVEDPLRGELTRIAPNMYSNSMDAFPMKVQGSGTTKNDEQMTDNTYLMQRVFSSNDPVFERNFALAIVDAAERGQSSYKDGNMGIRLFSDGDVAIAEDEDTGERTAITVGENGEMQLSPMDGSGSDDSPDGGYGVGEYPADDITGNIDNNNAMDPEVYVPIDTGIEDEDLAGLLGDPSESFGEGYDDAPEAFDGTIDDAEDEEVAADVEGNESVEDGDEDEGAVEDDDEDDDASKAFSYITGADWRMFSEAELMQLANASGIPSDEESREELPFDDIAGNLEDGDSMNPDVYVPINTGIEDEDLAGLYGDPSESFPDGGCSECEEGKEAAETGDPETAVFSYTDEEGKTFHFSEDDMINAVVDNANDMMAKVKELEETKDKKLAEEVAEEAKSVKEQADLLADRTDTDVEDVRNQSMKAFSFAHEVYNGKYDSIQEGIAVASSTQKVSPRTTFQNLLFSESPAGADAPVMSLNAPVAPIPTEPSIEAQIANPVAEEEGEPGVVIENITVNGDMNVGGGAEDEAGIAPAEPKNFSDVKMYSDVQPGVEGGTSVSKLLFGQY